jgi:hypothetical protein
MAGWLDFGPAACDSSVAIGGGFDAESAPERGFLRFAQAKPAVAEDGAA